MESAEIYRKLNDVFRDVFDDDEIVVHGDLTANDVDGWDSLRHVRLLLTVERTFGVKFSASEAIRLNNVGDLAQLVQSKIQS
jgi:acyl carrier protein